MCTKGSSKAFQSHNRSIIKEVIHTESIESDCISDDDHNHQISSSNTDKPTITITTCPQYDINPTNLYCSNNTSYENIREKSASFSSHSPVFRRKDQYFSREQFRSSSPNPYRQGNNQQHISLLSHSFEDLLLSPLHETLTRDSGTGDSVVHLSPETPANPIHYDVVPIFGSPKFALIANRYDFDSSKVEEYRNRKHRIIPKSPFRGRSTRSSIPEKPSNCTRQNSGDHTKPNTLLSRLIKTLKPFSTNQLQIEPIIRHHSSQSATEEDP